VGERVYAAGCGDLTRVLGPGVDVSEAGFGNWECRWKSATSGLSAHLIFDRNDPLGPNDGSYRNFHGHDTRILEEPEEPDCLARVVNRQDISAEGKPVDELVKITVRGAQRPDQLCVPAEKLSEAVAAKLPSAR
jgi:eukaryotic-like serine/threonine-protein kinase